MKFLSLAATILALSMLIAFTGQTSQNLGAANPIEYTMAAQGQLENYKNECAGAAVSAVLAKLANDDAQLKLPILILSIEREITNPDFMRYDIAVQSVGWMIATMKHDQDGNCTSVETPFLDQEF